MAGIIIADDLGLKVTDLERHRSGVALLVNGQANGAQANYTPQARATKSGYPEIGEPVFLSYDRHDIDLVFPDGKNRGVVFEPNDATRQFRATFVELPGGLYKTYNNIKEDSVNNYLKAFVMYAIPDGLENLVAPRPKICNAHGRPVQ